ncbi:GDSL-type esterase/lipase family protein [Candidatus Uabimicrobium sp. HlEnr_7]|uniref:GDSL-type esterase/lipase family protein n=1 Tax=Candidatus Uabimicrobium helgolandensis TaxID=3095367 RepID=UPI00355785C4
MTEKKSKWKKRVLWSIIITIIIAVGGYIMAKSLMRRASFWESSITAFEKQDKLSPPPLQKIVFVGSSSFNYWNTLKEDMHPLPVINRGFGGSYMHHLTYYATRIILPYKPKIVVVYCGENDIADSFSPNEVLQEFETLVKIIHAELQQAKIFYVSIKPPVLRSMWRDKFNETNQKIKTFAEKHPQVSFIDITSVMLNDTGSVNTDLFTWDRIHINQKGYKLWTSIIKPQITKVWEK